jgi:hypothetical protein
MFPVLLCFVVCIVGLAVFALMNEPANPKLSRIAFAMFWVGLFTFLMRFSYIAASVR